jgi:hypothetical protein
MISGDLRLTPHTRTRRKYLEGIRANFVRALRGPKHTARR